VPSVRDGGDPRLLLNTNCKDRTLSIRFENESAFFTGEDYLMAGTNVVSGLSSGIDWRNSLDQLSRGGGEDGSACSHPEGTNQSRLSA